jgi:hypothetical protein
MGLESGEEDEDNEEKEVGEDVEEEEEEEGRVGVLSEGGCVDIRVLTRNNPCERDQP